MSITIPFPSSINVYRMADWAELYVLHNQSLSKSKLSSLLIENDNDNDAFVDSIMIELELRLSQYQFQPYNIIGNKIIQNIQFGKFPEYCLCLLFSLYGASQKHEGTSLFERISEIGVGNYLDGDSQLIGFPSGSTLSDQVNKVALRMNEVRGAREFRSQDKDKGLDIIVWKSHNDGRNNQVVLLIQCGAGFTYNRKQPISIIAWREFINFAVDPLIGITVPSIVNVDEWREVRDIFHLIFDRPRILNQIYKKSTKISPELKKQILKWCQKEMT